MQQASDKKLFMEFSQASETIGVPLTAVQIEMFEKYYRELLIWNEKINLVSVKEPLDVVVKHFLDSMTPLPFIPPKSLRLLDIGSGGGFPGLPLKIASPILDVWLLEPSRKKVSFLKHLIRVLTLQGAAVINRRAEDLLEEGLFKAAFDIVISRAALKIPVLLTMARFFLAPGGLLLVMKGKDILHEIKASEPLAAANGLCLVSVHDFSLPLTGDQRKMAAYKKAI